MKTKGQSTLTMIITGIIVVIAVMVYLFFNAPNDVMLGEGELSDAEVAIHIIDVGQGDAIFIDNKEK